MLRLTGKVTSSFVSASGGGMKICRYAGIVFALVALSACEQNDVDVFSLAVGTCFDEADANMNADEVASVPVVDCEKPHDNEAFHFFDIEGNAFPGEEEMAKLADEGCLGAFETYVGRDYQTSRFVITYLLPTEQSWSRQKDREVVCFLYDMDLAKLTGSARGSGE